jgi:hypothetical protein
MNKFLSNGIKVHLLKESFYNDNCLSSMHKDWILRIQQRVDPNGILQTELWDRLLGII